LLFVPLAQKKGGAGGAAAAVPSSKQPYDDGEMEHFQFGNPQAQAYFQMQGNRGGAKKGKLTAKMNQQKRQSDAKQAQKLRGRKRGKKDRSSFACIPQNQKEEASLIQDTNADANFEAEAAASVSKHTDLQMPGHSEVKRTIEQLPNPHEDAFQRLSAQYRGDFPTWIAYLKAGFNLLLFGFGSKRHILGILLKSFLPF
jgi:hypothetical protein